MMAGHIFKNGIFANMSAPYVNIFYSINKINKWTFRRQFTTHSEFKFDIISGFLKR